MGKLTIRLYFFLFLNSVSTYAQTDAPLSSILFPDQSISMAINKEVKIFSLEQFSSSEEYIKDKEFHVTPFFNESTSFWFDIYANYTSDYVVIHDRQNPSIIYKVLDFTDLHNTHLPINIVQNLRRTTVSDEIAAIRSGLQGLAENKTSGGTQTEAILRALSRSGQHPPAEPALAREFWQKKIDNIRSQTGQRDFIKQGLSNYLPFKNYIDNIFESFDLPRELIAIAFLESSFNTEATSKVGASGIWQFMSRTGRHFLDIDRYRDDRRNTLIATVAALHLLRENYRSLNSWDLAIVAYNSGTRHLLNAKRQLGIENLTLEDYFTHYHHPQIGFASRSFYSSFLALTYVLKHKSQIFNMDKVRSLPGRREVDSDNLSIYVSLCSFRPSWLFSQMKNSSPEIRFLNRHLLSDSRTFPRGTLIVSDRPLTDRRYFPVQFEHLPLHYPKNLRLLIANQSCSTR